MVASSFGNAGEGPAAGEVEGSSPQPQLLRDQLEVHSLACLQSVHQ